MSYSLSKGVILNQREDKLVHNNKQFFSCGLLDKHAMQSQKSSQSTLNLENFNVLLTQKQIIVVEKHEQIQLRQTFDRKSKLLSQIQKQNLINLTNQKNKLKKQNKIFKIEYLLNQENRKRIKGGGACCSSQGALESEFSVMKIQEFEQKDVQTKPLNKTFEKIYSKKVKNHKYISEKVQKQEQYLETKDLIEQCLSGFREEITVNLNSKRTHTVEIFNLCLLYIISGAQYIDRDDQNQIFLEGNIFLDQLRENIKIFACQDVEFIYSFFSDLNDQDLDSNQLDQLQQVISFVQKLIEGKIEENEKQELLSNIENLAFNKSDQLQHVWQIVDRAHEKIRTFTKFNIICSISALWAQKQDKFGQFQDISAYDEMIFHIQKFIEFSQKQSSSYFILYILVQINYLLEKLIQNEKFTDIAVVIRERFKQDQVVQQFIKMLKQQSIQQQQSENFLLFFKFSVKDVTYRFLSDAILLKFYSILKYEDISEYIAMQQRRMSPLNQSFRLIRSSLGKLMRNQREIQTKLVKVLYNINEKENKSFNLKINSTEIDQLEDTIKDQNNFIEKITIKLIEKWELEARQRMERDIALKDDILLEVQDLYIDQNLSYLCGNQIFNQNQSQGSAIDQIITQFLIPNQKSQSVNGGSQRDFLNIMDSCLQNKHMKGLLFLPINLYLFTRMIIIKTQSEIKKLIKGISDQISIQEVFFREQFNREAVDFMNLISSELSDKTLKNEIISVFFAYFQTISIQMFCNKGVKSNFLQLNKDEIAFSLQQQIKNMINQDDQTKLKDKIMNYLLFSAVKSLFLINPDNFEIEAAYKFPSQIESVSMYNDQCAVYLQNSFKYFGSVSTGFKQIQIQGQGAILFKEQIIIYHQGQMEIYDIKQNPILINSIYSQEFTKGLINKQGTYLVTIQDTQVSFWNFEQLQLIQNIEEHTQYINHASISPDGKFLVTLQEEISCIKSLAYSKNGKNLAIISWEGIIKIWSYEKGYQQIKQLSTDCSNNTRVIISQDGKYLVSSSYSGICKIWNIQKDYELIKTIEFEKSIESIALSQDSKYLKIGSSDKQFQIYNVQSSFKLVKAIQFGDKDNEEEDEDGVISLQTTQKYLLSYSSNEGCKLWDFNNKFQFLSSSQDQAQGAANIKLSPNDRYLLIKTQQGGSRVEYLSAVFMADGRWIVSSIRQLTITMLSFQNRERKRTYQQSFRDKTYLFIKIKKTYGQLRIIYIDQNRFFEEGQERNRAFSNFQEFANKNIQQTNPVCFLVGNKCDLQDQREVSYFEAESLAQSYGFYFFETSSLTGYNVNILYEQMVDKVLQTQ
ncbi:hypothetical protein ABPG72_005371 [Tetrahymena utriculariae]